jgi:hypothetical protein
MMKNGNGNWGAGIVGSDAFRLRDTIHMQHGPCILLCDNMFHKDPTIEHKKTQKNTFGLQFLTAPQSNTPPLGCRRLSPPLTAYFEINEGKHRMSNTEL